jgi:hypothetical protein
VTENNEISEDTERAGCSVVFNVIIELSVGVDGELTVTLPKDAYMTDRETEAGYTTVRLSSLCDSFTSGHTVSYEIPKDELFPGCAAEILLIEGAPKVASVKVRDGMLTIEGSMQYSILAKGTEGEMLGAKLTRPLTINEKIDTKECDIIRAATALAVGEESCTVDANTAYISSRINLCAVVTCERPVEYLNSLSVGDPIPPNDKCQVYVYYPDRDDTIWSVAKKYKVPVARILQDNMIPRVEGVDDSDLPLADMERIIITKI